MQLEREGIFMEDTAWWVGLLLVKPRSSSFFGWVQFTALTVSAAASFHYHEQSQCPMKTRTNVNIIPKNPYVPRVTNKYIWHVVHTPYANMSRWKSALINIHVHQKQRWPSEWHHWEERYLHSYNLLFLTRRVKLCVLFVPHTNSCDCDAVMFHISPSYQLAEQIDLLLYTVVASLH